MLYYRIQIFTIVSPFFGAFLGIALELLFLVLEVGFHLLGFVQFPSEVVLSYSLLLVHLSFQLILMLFQLLLSEFVFFALFVLELTNFRVPGLFKSLIISYFFFLLIFTLFHLIFQRLLILFLQFLLLFFFFPCKLIFFSLELVNLLGQPFNLFILYLAQLFSLDLVKVFPFSDLLVNELLPLLFSEVLNYF